MSLDDVVWRPDPAVAARTRIARFMAAHSIDSLATLQRRSIDDPEWYWDAVLRDLGFVWSKPYTKVLDDSRGIMWPSWFPGGAMNLTVNALDRHVKSKDELLLLMGDAGMPEPPALPAGEGWRAALAAWSRELRGLLLKRCVARVGRVG